MAPHRTTKSDQQLILQETQKKQPHQDRSEDSNLSQVVVII